MLKASLSALFNTTASVDEVTRGRYREAARSVLNYGLGDIAGRLVAGAASDTLAEQIRSAIVAFEPRVKRHTLTVERVWLPDLPCAQVTFAIVGELAGADEGMGFRAYSQWDAETGVARVRFASGAERAHG
ncbi:type VI secretion system protein ImpF [Luteibacter sp. Sphag1AF]|uniref:GPW/gp25 family protein n=1 Tax=Luteibacter sp. Sphag1AF TaxID=2587031 RepID=UPI001612274B|nr:GPW/gp25 family protein [Luteibacter sp. Sphag1AF]MBB3226953.1 type VI secretion system protein ImpF [Luteibacter sp. Sphag1AF]